MDDGTQVKVLSISPTYQRCVNTPTLPFLAIRDEYMALTSEPCSAALLGVFEHWTNLRRMSGEDSWLVKTHDDLVAALRGIWSKINVRRALARLLEFGFLEMRRGEGFDKRSRWRLAVECVQSALEQIFPCDQEITSKVPPEQIEGIENESSKVSGEQIDVIGGADESYIDSLNTESSGESSGESPHRQESRAGAREGGGGFLNLSPSLQNVLQNEDPPTFGFKTTVSPGAAPHPPSSAVPPSPPANVMAVAWMIARKAFEAGRVKTSAEQYALGIAARMMLGQGEVVQAVVPAYGPVGSLDAVIRE